MRAASSALSSPWSPCRPRSRSMRPLPVTAYCGRHAHVPKTARPGRARPFPSWFFWVRSAAGVQAVARCPCPRRSGAPGPCGAAVLSDVEEAAASGAPPPSLRPTIVSACVSDDARRPAIGTPSCGAVAARARNKSRAATWLILPVVICLSQRLSHACVSMNDFGL